MLLIFIVSLPSIMIGAPSIRIALRQGEAAPTAGQPFYITVTLQDINADLPKLQVPGAKTLYQHESGSSMSQTIVNGHVSSTSSKTYTVTLRPEKQGKLTIPAITIGGVKSNTLNVTVGARGVSSASSQSYGQDSEEDASNSRSKQSSGPRFIGKGNDNLFMVASVNKTTAYEQEALVYTVKLYSSFANIRFLGATEAPKFNGFTLEDSNPKVESLHFESYKGRQYACAVIARYIIFPQMKGKLKIQGNTYTVTAESRQEYWDPFWGPLSYGRPVQLSVQPNDIIIDVKPLPQPQPANFSGAVGHFSITSTLPVTKLATNQAASIIYTVKGAGNIKYLTLPDLAMSFPKQFDVSSPTPEITAAPNGNTVTGEVKFDCSFMPVEEGDFKIPELEFVYFNPSTGKYETSTARGYEVTVVKGKGGKETSGEILKFDSQLMACNTSLAKNHHVFAGSLWYWLMYPFLAIVSAIIMAVIILRRNSHADKEAYNARRARRLADRVLRHARKSLNNNDRDVFFHQILTALWGYAAHKLRMSGSELHRANIESEMKKHSVPEETIEGFIELLDQCEEAKYAGSGINMKDVYEKAAESLRDIDSCFK